MERLLPADFERVEAEFDAAVAAAPQIDRFCSSTDWILPCREAWSPAQEAFVLRSEHGWATLQVYPEVGGHGVLTGFDTIWGFACPLVGAEPAALARDLSRKLTGDAILMLSGIEPDSALVAGLDIAFGGIHAGPVMRRWEASLTDGLDAYLARRSPKLRSNLRRAARRAESVSVSFEAGEGSVEALFSRMLDVEERSWKGALRSGLLMPDMERFYRMIAERMARQGRLRVLFARCGGEDVGYILGGVRDGIYRGFQFSFDQRLGELSLGSLMQRAQIAALCEEGIETYDLGMDVRYKRRWADRARDTLTVAVLPR
jgi:hypothetical protein